MRLLSKRLLSTVMAATLVTANLVDGGSIGRAFASVTTETGAEVHQDANENRSDTNVDAKDAGDSQEQKNEADAAKGQDAYGNPQDADADKTVDIEAPDSSASKTEDQTAAGNEAASAAGEEGPQTDNDNTNGESAQGGEINASSEAGKGSEASGSRSSSAEGTTVVPDESETGASGETAASMDETTATGASQETTNVEHAASEATAPSETTVNGAAESGAAVPETTVVETTVPKTTVAETTAAAHKEIHVTFHVVDDLGNEISEKYDDVKVHFDSEGLLNLDQKDQAPVKSIRRQTGSMLAGLIKTYSKKYSYQQATINGEVIRAIRKSNADGVTVYEYTTDGENWTALNEDTEVLLVYARPESDARLYAEYLEEGRIKVTVELHKELPDGVELKVQELTPEEDNYDAYMTALADSARTSETEAKTYNKDNTLLYDISFIGTDEDGNPYEYQPDGDVSVKMEFLNGQLSQELGAAEAGDVEIRHLPVKEEVKTRAAEDGIRTTADLTDLTADDILVESVKDANVTIDKTAVQAADKDEEEEVNEDTSDASDAELEDNDDVESTEDADTEETAEDTDRNSTETGYKDQTSFTVSGFSVFALSDPVKGQQNAWNGTDSMTPGDFLKQFGIATDFSIFAENLVNNQHIEGNIATDNYYIDSQDSYLKYENLYSKNVIRNITVNKTVKGGNKTDVNTFYFGLFKPKALQPFYTFTIKTKFDEESNSIKGTYEFTDIQNNAKYTDLKNALKAGPVYVYELDPKVDLKTKQRNRLESGEKTSDGYTVKYEFSNGNGFKIDGNTIAGTEACNHIENIYLTDGQAINANSIKEVIDKHLPQHKDITSGVMGFFGALTYLGSDFAPYFVHSDGQKLENGNWVKVIAKNGTLLSGRNDVNKVSEEFRPLKNSPLITDQEHQHISDWLENTIVPISTSAAKLKTTRDPVSGATLHVVNIKGTHGKLSEDLAAANINFRDKNDNFISDGDYLLINIDTEGREYKAKNSWEHDGYDLNQVYIAGDTVKDNFDDYRTGHVIYNLLDHVDTDDEGNVTNAEPYTKTITNNSGSGVIIAPEATFKQNDVYGGQVFVKTYIRSGSEYHKSSLTDHHGHANVHDASVFVTNETDNHISVIKNLEGRDWKNTDTFEFNLEADDERNANGVKSPLPEDEKDKQIIVTKKNRGGFFGNIPYEQAGVYHYKVIEKSDNPIEGITYATPHYVTVTVTEASESADQSSNNDEESVNTDRSEETQDHDGESQEVSSKKFVTEVVWEDPDAVVTSDEKQVKVSLKVAKNQSSDDWQDATFILQPDDKKNTAGNGVPLPNANDCTVTLKKDAQCQSFGEITFQRPGDYHYVIREQSDKTADDEGEERNRGKAVTVSVVKQADGKLTATVTRTDNVVIMTNQYRPWIEVFKNLEGRAWKKEDSFTFTLEADNAKNITGVTSPLPNNAENGKVTVTVSKDSQSAGFGNISYDKEGEYHYKITEVKPDPAIEGLTYAEPKEVVVRVTADPAINDSNNGNIESNESAQDAETENSTSQEVNSQIKKKLKIQVEWVDKDAVVTSDDKKVQVVLKAVKDLAGKTRKDTDQYTFELQSDNAKNNADIKSPLPDETKRKVTFKKDAQCQNFGEITFKQSGVYHYVIREQSDKTADDEGEERNRGKAVTVSVVKQADGKLTATVTRTDNVVIMTNCYKTTTLVLNKIWEDNDNETNRPNEIMVYIKPKDGETRGVKLCKDNQWSTTINGLPYVTSYKGFEISEGRVEGYTCNGISQDGKPEITANGNKITITLTNTAEQPEPTTPVNPTKPSSDITKSSEESSTETPTSSSESGSTPATETTTTAPETSSTTPPETSPVVTTPAETTAPETSPVETTTSSHHEHHDHDDKPTPGPTTTAPDTTTAVETTTVAETTTEAGTTAPGHEHSEDITGPDGEVLGADRDRAHQTDTSQDGDVLGENRSKVAGANRQVKTGDISMMRLYAVGALVAIALLIGWVIRWKKKQR